MTMKRADILRKAFKDCGVENSEAAVLRTLPVLEGLECVLVPGEMPQQSVIEAPFIWGDTKVEIQNRTGVPVMVQPDLPFEPGPSTADGHRTIQLTLKF